MQILQTQKRQRQRHGIPWRGICGLLEAIEAEQTPMGFFQRALEKLKPLVPYDYGLAVLFDPNRPDRVPVVISRSAPRELIERYFRHCIRIDSLRLSVSTPGALRPGLPYTGYPELVSELFATTKAPRSIGVTNVRELKSRWFALSLHRSAIGPFSDLERRTLEALFPHLHNLFNVLVEPLEHHDARLLDTAVSAGLSRREREVYLLLCDRLTIAEIAQRLFISRHTAAKHIEHIYDKLLVSGRRGACSPAEG